MASHRILDLTDSALVAYLIAEIAGTEDDVFPGKAVGDKSLPNTVCASDSWAAPDGQEYTGNSVVSATVTVSCAAFKEDETVTTATDDSATRVAATFDPFYQADPQALGAAISAEAQAAGLSFTCIAVRVTGGDRTIADASWHDSITLELLCCPSALT